MGEQRERWLTVLGALVPPGFSRRPVAVPDMPLWRHWNIVHQNLPLWWFVTTGMFKSGRRRTGFDAIRTLRMEPRVIGIMERLARLDDAMLDALIDLAKANSERQTYFSRSILLAYITIPFTVGAIIAQLAPDALIQFFIDYAAFWGGGLAGAGVAVLLRQIFDAQARQLLLILEMARIERRVPSSEIIDDGGAADRVG